MSSLYKGQLYLNGEDTDDFALGFNLEEVIKRVEVNSMVTFKQTGKFTHTGTDEEGNEYQIRVSIIGPREEA